MEYVGHGLQAVPILGTAEAALTNPVGAVPYGTCMGDEVYSPAPLEMTFTC